MGCGLFSSLGAIRVSFLAFKGLRGCISLGTFGFGTPSEMGAFGVTPVINVDISMDTAR